MTWMVIPEDNTVISLDSLAEICGYFVEDCDDHCNNGYGCNHPDNDQTEKCKNGHAECHAFACPVAYKVSCPVCENDESDDIEISIADSGISAKCTCGAVFRVV